MRRALLLSLWICASALPAAALTPYLVKDVNPVAVPAGSSPQDFVKLGALTLFRATDAAGVIQPDTHDQNYGTYVINHVLPIEVFVGDPGGPQP